MISPGSVLARATLGILCFAGCGRIGYDALSGGASSDASTADAVETDAAAPVPSFAHLCSFSAHVIVENGISVDDSAGGQVSEATKVGCGTSATTRIASQDDADEVDQNSGRPLSPPSELIILGGGDGPHRVVRYLLAMDTPLAWGGSPVVITERSTGRVVAQGTTDAQNDFLLIQVVEEPIGNSISLSAQGMQANGTSAAALYWEKDIGRWINESDRSWLVVQWSDTDAISGPSESDTYTLLSSG